MVIEGQLFGQAIERKPSGFAQPGGGVYRLTWDQGVVGDSNAVFAWIAIRPPKSV